MISIITATHNSSGVIATLIDSLNRQTDENFEWIVVDGASTDGTVDLITERFRFAPHVICEADSGIYDALNKGIRSSTSGHYVCIGSDDYFFDNAVELMNQDINTVDADVYSYAVKFGNRIKRKSNWPTWLALHRRFSPAHSVATAFSKSLHEKFGYYSLDYKIGADLDFMLQIFADPQTKLHYHDVPVGYFNPAGISSTSPDLALDEIVAITKKHGFNPHLQKVVNFYRRCRYKLADRHGQ